MQCHNPELFPSDLGGVGGWGTHATFLLHDGVAAQSLRNAKIATAGGGGGGVAGDGGGGDGRVAGVGWAAEGGSSDTVHLHSSLYSSSPLIPADSRRRSTSLLFAPCSVTDEFFLFFPPPFFVGLTIFQHTSGEINKRVIRWETAPV